MPHVDLLTRKLRSVLESFTGEPAGRSVTLIAVDFVGNFRWDTDALWFPANKPRTDTFTSRLRSLMFIIYTLCLNVYTLPFRVVDFAGGFCLVCGSGL